ncbi:hypothetical protein Tco_0629815 [Tanacetum coccineum]|uniref:Uncharacterized protein n=1 Tax=Tanacetum coccineum TaxID=301880 RepID=A0ABQ4WUH5_9ASTR
MTAMLPWGEELGLIKLCRRQALSVDPGTKSNVKLHCRVGGRDPGTSSGILWKSLENYWYPTVTDQMAQFVCTLRIFWEDMDHLDDRLHLGHNGSVIQLPLVLRPALERVSIFLVHTFLEFTIGNLYLAGVTGYPYSYSPDLSFSGGGDDEGSAAANSVMHVSADGDCGKQTSQSQMPLYSQLEGTGSSVGTVEGSAGARCSSSSSSSSSFSTSSSSLSSSDDSLS